MSSLSLPRIIFQGTTSWDPNTVNNQPTSYDEIAVQPALGGMTLDEYAQWLFKMAGDNLNGSWNVFGNYGVELNAKVTGTQILPFVMTANDPLIGLPVTIAGEAASLAQKPSAARMVDVDPFSPYTTQIIYTTLSIGNSSVGVSGKGECRMFSRWPNMSRNLGVDPGVGHAGRMGVIWQAALPTNSLAWGSDYASSRTLAVLRATLEKLNTSKGLVFLFASYCTLYLQSATWKGKKITTLQELGSAYQDGFQGGNPAVSTMLGRVGLWGPGELASVPTDILLAPQAAKPLVRSRTLPQGRGFALMQEPTPQAPLGPAQARVLDRGTVLVLDLLSTFPEENGTLAKANRNTFVLQVVSSDGSSPTQIASLTSEQYGQQAYDLKGGIVEIPLVGTGLAGLIARGTLQLVSNSGPDSGTVALEQVPLVTETDQRGLWVDEGTTTTIQVTTYQNGATPPTGTVQVLVVPYRYDSGLDQFFQITDKSQAIFKLSDGKGNPLSLAPVLGVGGDGTSTFTVSPVRAGFCSFFFFPFSGSAQPTPPSTIAPLTPRNFFVVLRALPFDNALESTPASEITWQFIYQKVLSTWDVVYPFMSTVFPLSDERMVENSSTARAIRKRLDADPLKSSLYMPISRDMSVGKSILLEKFLAPFSDDGGEENAAPPSSQAPTGT